MIRIVWNHWMVLDSSLILHDFCHIGSWKPQNNQRRFCHTTQACGFSNVKGRISWRLLGRTSAMCVKCSAVLMSLVHFGLGICVVSGVWHALCKCCFKVCYPWQVCSSKVRSFLMYKSSSWSHRGVLLLEGSNMNIDLLRPSWLHRYQIYKMTYILFTIENYTWTVFFINWPRGCHVVFQLPNQCC